MKNEIRRLQSAPHAGNRIQQTATITSIEDTINRLDEFRLLELANEIGSIHDSKYKERKITTSTECLPIGIFHGKLK